MFEAKLIKGIIWKKLIDAIKEVIQEARWEITKERGIAMQAMDGSHVCLVSLYLSAEGFDEFRCDHNLTIGTKLDSMSKIFKCAATNDIVTLRTEGVDSDTLTFIFQSNKNERVSEFEMKLMDIDSENMGIPDHEYACMITMPSAEFSRIIHDLSILGENASITCVKDGVSFSSTGDLGKGTIKLTQNFDVEKEEEAVVIDMHESCTQTFTLKYLGYMAKAAGLSTRVAIQLSNDHPLIVEFKIEGTEEKQDFGFLRYYLAPKIDDDELMA